MPPRPWQVRVQDMIGATERIRDLTADKTMGDLDEDISLLESVLFNFIVIGEAARHIPAALRQRWAEIPWSDVAGTRNVIAHGYFDVSVPILWRTIRDDFPQLISALHRMLREADQAEDAAPE